jgi:outer membrane protein assembly factor BamB
MAYPTGNRFTIGRFVILTSLVFACCTPGYAAEGWPQFLGPNGDGHSSAIDLPLQWSETSNIVWKTPIHDRGWSSPVILGDQVWLTTASPSGHHLFAVCLDRKTGKVLKDLKLFDVEKPQYCHPFNSYASPTPVIEPGRVYVTFGSAGTACIDTRSFRVLWERRDLECNHFMGAGSSPILFQDLLVMHFDGSDQQYVVALNKRTGKTIWKTDRSVDFQDLDASGKPAAEGDYRKAYATPHVATFDGRPELISLGSRAAYGYDPRSGRELWRVEERGEYSASSRPTVGLGMIFFSTGFNTGQLFAVRGGGRGVITNSHIAWKMKRSVSNKPSVLRVGDLLYVISDDGIASCVEAATGAVHWQERIGGEFSASPAFADGKIWLFSEDGTTTVIAPGKKFQLLARNSLGDGFLASPAIVDRALYLRSRTHLYRVEKLEKNASLAK